MLGRRALATLVALNGAMFFVETISGWRAESMGLIADGLESRSVITRVLDVVPPPRVAPQQADDEAAA